MTVILAVETSTLTASVALRVDERLIARESGVNTHAEVLLDLIDECLKEAGLALGDLDTIAVGAGPGSFTGLRIGMATVKGLCFATGVSLTPISSLAALHEDCRLQAGNQGLLGAGCETPGHSAEGANAPASVRGSVSNSFGAGLLVPVLDARRKEVFVSMYRDGQQLGPERVVAPEELAKLVDAERNEGERALLFGDGATKYRAQFAGIGLILEGCRQTPSAAAVAMLARSCAATSTLAATAPSYVRLPEAQIKFPNGNPGGAFSIKKPGAK